MRTSACTCIAHKNQLQPSLSQVIVAILHGSQAKAACKFKDVAYLTVHMICILNIRSRCSLAATAFLEVLGEAAGPTVIAYIYATARFWGTDGRSSKRCWNGRHAALPALHDCLSGVCDSHVGSTSSFGVTDRDDVCSLRLVALSTSQTPPVSL